FRHGSILNRESPTDKKQKVERSTSHDFDPTDSSSKKTKSSSEESRSEIYGLVQRCVIIQKDDNGFGLTMEQPCGLAYRQVIESSRKRQLQTGSYVALTVQGRPPGLPQFPLADSEVEPSVVGHMSPIMTSPHSPGASGNMERITSPVLMGEENNVVHNQKVEILRKMLQKEQERLQLLQEDYSRTPAQRLLKEIQEAKKHIPQLQEQLSKATGSAQDGAAVTSSKPLGDGLAVSEIEADPGDGLGRIDYGSGDASRPSSESADSPKSGLKERIYLEENSEKSEVIQDTDTQSLIGSPSTRIAPHIIGAEDDDFGTEHEQINGQCSCFQSIELLKSRPAHLAVFLHHVVSQFDPATLLCYLYSDLYKQTNSKETRRVFLEFHQFFLDRSAHLKVSVPDEISVDLEKRRPELIPEDLHRHYIQTMQERVHPEVQRHLEDFRQKRSMGLTLAESELTKIDAERDKDRVTLEKERACAEQIVAKIEEVLSLILLNPFSLSSTMQYVILMYMKHLGVKVKEPRNLEHKRGRIGFLPKIKAYWRGSLLERAAGEVGVGELLWGEKLAHIVVFKVTVGRAMELQKQRHPKHISTPSSVSPEPQDSAKLRQSGLTSEGVDTGYLPANSMSSMVSGATLSQEGGKENDMGSKQVGETPASGDSLDGTPRTPSTIFDFPPPPLDQVQEEEWEVERVTEHGTPKPFRKFDSIAFGESQSEDEQFENDLETDPPNWQQLVSREVLLALKPCEIKRQEVINELFYTERAHVRTLKVLDQVFYQRVSREGILSPSELRKIFSNLEDILQLHIGLNEQMKAVRKRNETSVIDQIGEDLLTWFSGPGEEKLKHAAATFCSNQPFALEMIKSRQKKDSRFQTFVQDAESNPLCRRLQLKDIIPTQMQRLTKYPLLLDNIAKYTEWPTEREKVKKAADHCRQILNYVNQAVKEAENKQNLDLTKRKMIHEGPLVWKVNRDKTIGCLDSLNNFLHFKIFCVLLLSLCHVQIIDDTSEDNELELAGPNLSDGCISEGAVHKANSTATVTTLRVNRDLGLESPLMSSKPQSHSLDTSGKSEVDDDLFVAERQFAKEQHADGTLKEVGVNYQITVPDPHLPVSEERWALDALRNLGLLKQLLVQQLGLTEKSTQEDWPHFPRCRTASLGAQADSGTQKPGNIKAYHPCEGQMPFRTGTGDISTCYSPRTSTESSVPRDSVVLAFQDSQASNILVMDHMIMTPEMPPAEPEGGLDESGEHFFDAREAHSDDNPSEGDGAVKKEEKDVNLRISGKFLSHLNFDFNH
ncbi:hypothetical protein DBR06_SOUSAS510011, partial [Sousa chinensis]